MDSSNRIFDNICVYANQQISVGPSRNIIAQLLTSMKTTRLKFISMLYNNFELCCGTHAHSSYC